MTPEIKQQLELNRMVVFAWQQIKEFYYPYVSLVLRLKQDWAGEYSKYNSLLTKQRKFRLVERSTWVAVTSAKYNTISVLQSSTA